MAAIHPLGFVFYGKDKYYPFGIQENEWTQHLSVFGRSGSGKSNIGFIIFLNLLQKGKPVLIFDWKRNYRDLLVEIRNKEILVFTVGRSVTPFHFNPLIPPPGSTRLNLTPNFYDTLDKAFLHEVDVKSYLSPSRHNKNCQIQFLYRILSIYDLLLLLFS